MRNRLTVIAGLVLAALCGPAGAQGPPSGSPSANVDGAPAAKDSRDDPTDGSSWRDRLAAARARHAAWVACVTSRLPGCDPEQTEEAQAVDPMQQLLDDDTLVPGDVVSTPNGLRVFRGQTGAPHTWADFQ